MRRRGPVPPGRKIVLASVKGVDAFEEICESFMRTIFGISEYLITDESRLTDFIPMGERIEPILEKIMAVYKIGLVPSNLLLLFAELHRNLEEAKKRLPPIWQIFDHPADYPEDFVVRVFYGDIPTFEVHTFSTLQHARQHVLRAGASVHFLRDTQDDPKIVESWV